MKHARKRYLALLCCACLLLGLFACSAAKTSDAAPAEAKDAAPTSAKPAEAAPSRASGGTELVKKSGEAGYERSDGASSDVVYGAEPAEAPDAVLEAEPAAPAAEDGESGGDPPVLPTEPEAQAGPFVLTAAEWNDNDNWPFFTNLVNTGTISFPSFGIDPRNRLKVTLTDEAGAPLWGETVSLRDGDIMLWSAQTDRNGVAYLFWTEDHSPNELVLGGTAQPLPQQEVGGDEQNPGTMRPATELTFTAAASAPAKTELQVMFIVDTTGSMSDELSYLQKDFTAIAEDVGTSGVRWSVNFYRDTGDDYVTKCNPFTGDIAEVRGLINAEYAAGGGDTPEAVAEILTQTLTAGTGWADGSEKLAFLIFDAPPHEGKEQELIKAVQSAAAKGIRVVPVVASNAERETELFGRALAICTGGTYVFLTDDSGVGDSHLEPIVGDYEVELLHDLIVRIINAHKP